MDYIKSNDLFADKGYEHIYDKAKHPMIIADNIMSPDNIGALIRLGDNIGADEIVFLGEEEACNIKKIRRAAASSRDNIKWSFTTADNIRQIVGNERTIVAIETTTSATCVFNTTLPNNIAFVVGNESKGMRQNILEQCDMSVFIPVPGPTRSLNVSHAASVVLFEWLRQMMTK